MKLTIINGVEDFENNCSLDKISGGPTVCLGGHVLPLELFFKKVSIRDFEPYDYFAYEDFPCYHCVIVPLR